MSRALAFCVALFIVSSGGARAADRFIPLLQPGDAIPAVSLIDQRLHAFDLTGLPGTSVAVSFIYTRCSDARMCPLVSAKFARAQHAIGTSRIHLVLVSLDPTFDTPHVLARYGRSFGQDPNVWTLATGSHSAIDELAARLGIASSTTKAGAIVHTEGVIIVDPRGRIAQMIYGNEWTAADLIDATRLTLGGSETPLSAMHAWLSAAIERCGGGSFVLGGYAMLGLFGMALIAVSGAFAFAFRSRSDTPTPSRR